MKPAKHLSVMFALLSLLLALGTAALVFTSLEASPRLLGRATAAETRTEALMDALCSQDHTAASRQLLGQPPLEPGRTPDSQLAALLWDAYQESLTYEFTGDCESTGSGLTRQVFVTCLDIPALMQELKTQAQSLLDTQARAADPSQVYREDGSYQTAFVMEVLTDGAAAILADSPPQISHALTLSLESRDGQWWILPDQALLNLLCGSLDS